MDKISHIVISRMSFEDKKLLKTYLKITKEILVPSLKSQINKNFKWGLIINAEDIKYVYKYLNIDFIPFKNKNDFFKYVKSNNINIQTRHDIDDYMSELYIEKIQETYKENIKKYDKFLIQAQPLKFYYHTNEEVKMKTYTDTRNSMFISLCQKIVNYSIFKEKHHEMYKVTNNIITLNEGYVKWVIHGNNISCKNNTKL